MINDDPDARGLIAIALRAFRDTILPLVPADQRFTALMIANALGLAERELATGDTAEPALASAIAGLIDRSIDGGLIDQQSLDGRKEGLAERLPALCAAIEAGRFDGPDDTVALRAVLMDLTRARLAVSNPKRLAEAGR